MREIDKIDPPVTLRNSILACINKEERHRAKILLMASATTILFSIVGIVYSVQYMAQRFYESSLYSYFSLLHSDPDIVFTYWKDFVLSLADTVPFMEITVPLVAVAILLISVKILAKNIRVGLSTSFSN